MNSFLVQAVWYEGGVNRKLPIHMLTQLYATGLAVLGRYVAMLEFCGKRSGRTKMARPTYQNIAAQKVLIAPIEVRV